MFAVDHKKKEGNLKLEDARHATPVTEFDTYYQFYVLFTCLFLVEIEYPFETS